ncbi:4'-phosphopantetheinyl transferase family protein [Sphingomonas sp. AX6]|uniref:4'-phosphopantetheinyl transferase family protein n=1 Tax=Sphingomonas sp. AX6 TaxID=2653171 RepID=UPI001356FF72|nr:4'-phosphopantetheinyl transferase superfamily protein [Sphingomonas sp. AX6]
MATEWPRPDLRHRSLLSSGEIERAGRLRSARLRDRFIVAHAARCVIIDSMFGVTCCDQIVGLGPRGKPCLVDRPEIQFNLSYSQNRFAIAVARDIPIGIDIEHLRTIEDAVALATLHYSLSELDALAEQPSGSEGFDRIFLSVWTRKEAFLKALGRGLGDLPLHEIDCGAFRTETVRMGDRQIRTDTTLTSSYLVSWAWEHIGCLTGSSRKRQL